MIPKAWVEDVRGGDHGLFDDENREWLPNGRYRNMFWIPDAAKPAHLCLGVFGQLIAIMPEERMVVAKLSSWPDFVSDEHSFNVRQAIAAIAAALS